MISFRRQLFRVLYIFVFSSFLYPQQLISQTLPIAPTLVDEQQSEPIRVSVDRVSVGVLVTDSSGKFAEDLHRDNFHIFDNGVEQPITDFLDVEEPAQALVLIEAGPAVYLLEGSHLRAAQEFLSGLSADDRVAVVVGVAADDPQDESENHGEHQTEDEDRHAAILARTGAQGWQSRLEAPGHGLRRG